MIDSFVIPKEPCITSFAFSSDGTQYLVNAADHSIRVYNVNDNSICFKLFSAVDKRIFKVCKFARDDYIVAGSSEKAEHSIYIWNRHDGQFYSLIEGPKEGILDLDWHPTQPVIVTCSTVGRVYVWSKQYSDNWSAFNPGFTELEENEEYIEREDEFDKIDRDIKENKLEEEDKDINIYDKSSEDEENIYVSVKPFRDKFIKRDLSPLRKKPRRRNR